MIRMIKDFTPKGFRKMPGYGKSEHFDPGHTGRWDNFKLHHYTHTLLKGWLLYAAVMILLAAMGWRSYLRHELCFGPAVPLLFGTYLIHRSDDSSFSQSLKLIANVFILYAWKNVMFAMMEMSSAATVRGVSGSIIWIGTIVTGIMIAAGMYDSKHEMQSGFVSAVDLVSIAVLMFMSLRGSENMTLLYLTFIAMFVFAAVNLIFTLPAVLIKHPEERGNIIRFTLCMVAGCIPLAAGHFLSGSAAAGAAVYLLFFGLTAVTVIPGSIPRHNRRAILLPAGAVLAADYLLSFVNTKMTTASVKGVLKFIGRFFSGTLAVPESLTIRLSSLCTAMRAPVYALLRLVNKAVKLPVWMVSESGTYEGFQLYAVNHVCTYLVLALLVSCAIELSVRLRLKKN